MSALPLPRQSLPLQPNAPACNLAPALNFTVGYPKGKSHPDKDKQYAANNPRCRIWKQR